MKHGKWLSRISLLFFLVATLLSGCGSPPPAKETAAPVNLTVSAAASLKDALTEIKDLYGKEKPNATISYNFGASGSLQQQIEQGAPADIFISAAPKQMDDLQAKNLIDTTTRKDLLENKVVLISAKDSAITGFSDLAGDKVKKLALGEPQSVPAGKYAQEVLTKLNLAEGVKEKTVLAKDVRQVLTYVETANAEAGIVYETDAKVSDKVKIVTRAPEGSHSPVLYPGAVIKDSKNAKEAGEFLKYLQGPAAKAVFEKYGFTVLSK
ncbi:molybdate ABC transporter substrate-binding protein [Heliobacterium gestii]|uniref:Molybdate ABC transporter substrate-binding protein n=1 Tax=Heliomicrobium gestii TaxID=2699 RepID=A0A845L9A0_HELGE|nr:molybdate ABC transporter substrate-binding protein [Heliomicrobium gestii]MBM7865574.1 molybdate transport system substrate-binding protein [Heliomicrobium gestii]MZP41824.1 molybdate ABC transporter substrate-binding protein [Heliomicrobium gestii]